VDRKEIQNLANLAQLEISEDTLDEVASSITNVFALVNQLQAADTGDIQPMAHPLDTVQRLRADEITEKNVRDKFLEIAPASEDGLFLVPKVID